MKRRSKSVKPIGSGKWSKAVDRVTKRTAARISAELDRMIADLPENATPHMAIELVVRELAARQPWFLHLIMRDSDIRSAYAETATGRTITKDLARIMEEIARKRRR